MGRLSVSFTFSAATERNNDRLLLILPLFLAGIEICLFARSPLDSMLIDSLKPVRLTHPFPDIRAVYTDEYIRVSSENLNQASYHFSN